MMLTKKFIISNKLGLHARASAKLVNLASRYGSEIYLIRGARKADAKSILDVMMLAANKGAEVEVSVTGEDENQALEEIGKLIEGKFGEE